MKDSWDLVRNDLDGITDEKMYFWEPASGSWNVRRRSEASSARPVGKGDWVMDYAVPDPVPAPSTSIAWLLAHMSIVNAMHHDAVFGSGNLQWDDIEIHSNPKDAVAAWSDMADKLQKGVEAMSDADLDSEIAPHWWNGQKATKWYVLWRAVVECVHHGAEISALRDMQRSR